MSEQTPAQPRHNRAQLVGLLVLVVAVTGVLMYALFDRVGQTSQQTNTGAAIIEGQPYDGSTAIDPPRQLEDFTLINQHGDPVSLNSLRGKLTLMFFGYTHCPDVCPLTLLDYRRIRELLGDDADKVTFMMISVDGERDTPEELSHLLDSRGAADFVTALTGDEATLRRVGSDYGLFFEKVADPGSSENYLVDHTSTRFLINEAGQLVVVYAYGTEVDVIASSIRGLLPG